MQHLATVSFKTHTTHITVDQGKIYCFKFNKQQCDLDVFDNGDTAGDYIITPFPDHSWQVVVE